MLITRSSWKIRPGALTVTIKPLRPFIPKPRMSVIAASENTRDDKAFAFMRWGDALTAIIPESDVERLLNPVQGHPPLHLLLTMRALFMPGSPTRRWQWGVRLVQDGVPLICIGPRGISAPADADGFVHSAVHAFPAARGHGVDEWEFVLEDQNDAVSPALWDRPQRAAACAKR